MKILFVLSALLAVACAKKVDYSGYQVIAVEAKTQAQLDILEKWESSRKVNFWTHPSMVTATDVMVSPSALREFQSIAPFFGLAYTVKIPDVQKLIDQEYEQRMSYKGQKVVDWKHYNTYEEIVKFLDETAAEHLHVQNHEVGKTTEGRSLMVTKINTGEEGSKPRVWLDFGIHAREWITPAVGTYIIDQLLNNDENKDLLEAFEFYIMALHNPDGYVYSVETDRMWRKTRSYYENPYGCSGTDANRNFGHHWAEAGSSDWHCDDTFHGPEAFSEPETKLVSDYTLEEGQFVSHITIHSYSQLWMTPWAYSYNKPDAYDELVEIAKPAAAAIKAVHGKTFAVGTVPETVGYRAAGASTDWAHGVANIKYTYALELRDKGEYGFLLPPEQIIPACEETWAGLSTAIRLIAQKEFRK